ncbi:MAG: hypothetical protein RI945_274 [Candidatus Parcubacteria bacterium]
MCIPNDEQSFKCGCFPGTGTCTKIIAGKKKKKCPDTFSKDKLEEALEKAQKGHKLCEGRPVNKLFIKQKENV